MSNRTGKGKGNSFEREISKQLSLWWTGFDGEEGRDDIFWRSSSSGGRATQRSKRNQTTKGQYGDIAATDAIGESLLKAFTFELKRGYSKDTIADLLDKSSKAKDQQYETWFKKAYEDCKHAKSETWMIIHQRNRREKLAISPLDRLVDLIDPWQFYPMIEYQCSDTKYCQLFVFRFDEFLEAVHPEDIKDWIENKMDRPKTIKSREE